MILLFIGPSGSGKDTQAELIVKNFGYERVSTGDLIREIAKGDHRIHQLLNDRMNDGFMNDNFVFGLTEIYLDDVKAENIILSGVVRKESQVVLLDQILAKSNKKLDKVVYLDLNDEEAVRRMSGRLECTKCFTNYHVEFDPTKAEGICDKCGGELKRREDDNPESIVKRLADFHKYNDGIIEAYEKREILVRIDASQSVENTYQEIKSKLGLK